MSGADWVLLLVVVVLFVVSIWLAVAETAFVRMNRIRALALADEGSRRGDRLARMLEHPERTLNIVLLVVLVSQLTSATLLGVLLEGIAGPIGLVVGIVLQIVLFFVVGEVAPKTYAVQHTERAALMVTPFLWFLSNFAPLRYLSRGLIGIANAVLPGKGLKQGPFVTEEEIRTMADVAAEEDSIERGERKLIHSIFEFGDTVVREAMLPRPDMIAVSTDETIEDAIDRAIEGGFSRLPAYEQSTDNIVGLVYLKDLVRRARDGEGNQLVRTALREAKHVPEQKRVAELLNEMQNEQFHMAIVFDEHGGTVGLVTLEDLLEEIVGEIADEYDQEMPQLEHLPDGSLRVPGRTPIDDVSDELGIELPDTEWDTVGGLIFNLLGKVPDEGECVGFKSIELCAERMQGRRIVSVLITRRDETGEVPVIPPDAAVRSRIGRSGTEPTRLRRDRRAGPVVGPRAFRSGFVTLVGRPNVGKSTLVNQIVGSKVAIVSDRPQTTRTQIRGVRTTGTTQLVLLDTPGIHKPRTLLGERTNERARATLDEVDVVCMLIDASGPIGRGDRFVAEIVGRADTPSVLVVNKIDRVDRSAVAEHLAAAAAELGDFDAFVPLSARTGDGVDALVRELEARLPDGPALLPGRHGHRPARVVPRRRAGPRAAPAHRPRRAPALDHVVVERRSSRSGAAEPDRPTTASVLRISARILVERESQKGMVIGRGGSVLKEAGTRAREELERLLGTRVFLETRVSVERDWQRRAHALDRLGF